MKKHLLYLFLFALALGSCKKDKTDPILGNVDDRLSETLTAYKTQLAGAQFGWKGYLLTDTKVLATFLFSFTDKNRTTMSADYEPTPNESSYRLKALQRPTLLFDTYSTLHLIADPTPDVIGGETGEGYYSDFEFAFLSASADTIKLEGTFNKSKLILVRSKSAADNASAFTAPEAVLTTFSKLRTYFKQATIGGINCEVKIDPNRRIFGFNYLDKAGVLKSSSSNYFVSGTSLVLFDPIMIGSTTITGLSGVTFDASTGFISASTNGGVSLQIKEAISPIDYNKNDALSFLATGRPRSSWWESYNGFTVDGIIDAYGINTIPDFTDLDYYVTGANKGNFVCFTAGNFPYSSKITSTITANGFLLNTVTSIVGSTGNASAKTIIDKTTQNFVDPKGFYVIRVGSGFDLVSVKDARSWITFQ
ncbi:DUF4302 domain-containing protein [Pedobacter sp. D749]|uniref:DUF4302 domain-containing protein n=1 Tax=Pedobacter sp. D749 TaxID=2856523 RepID=UPI001C55E7D4|nr:DUF4302 domain-containing protein [Pedobacter sp. D749]QXU40681.1 DUF4302 domain-containing protein [Pedobacter sp. D749]